MPNLVYFSLIENPKLVTQVNGPKFPAKPNPRPNLLMLPSDYKRGKKNQNILVLFLLPIKTKESITKPFEYNYLASVKAKAGLSQYLISILKQFDQKKPRGGNLARPS